MLNDEVAVESGASGHLRFSQGPPKDSVFIGFPNKSIERQQDI